MIGHDAMTHSLGQRVPDGEGGAEQHMVALEEDEVPDPQHGGLGQAVAEQREEPLHGEHVGQGRLVARPCNQSQRGSAVLRTVSVACRVSASIHLVITAPLSQSSGNPAPAMPHQSHCHFECGVYGISSQRARVASNIVVEC